MMHYSLNLCPVQLDSYELLSVGVDLDLLKAVHTIHLNSQGKEC
jgi:hypothetical protein